MEIMFLTSSAELREWFEKNGSSATEVWIGFYKKSSSQKGITYKEAVDEALCFGWIDGVRKGIDDISYTNRFSPRKARSIWSDVNIKRVGELSELGLMRPAGLKAFEVRDQNKAKSYSYEEDNRALAGAYEEQFQANPKAWDYFQAQPPGYRKVANWWVMSAKREETRQKRLAMLIEASESSQRLPQVAGTAKR